MLIDWFTVVAQIVNFLILVVLLKVFLYDRVIRAMDEREEKVRSRLEEAEKKEKESEEEAEEYRRKNREMEEKRKEMLDQAREEAEKKRKDLTREARHEVENLQKRWKETLQREKDSFLRELKQLAGRQVYSVSRRALKDLADSELEESVARVFLKELSGMKKADRDKIAQTIESEGNRVTVRSALELSSSLRQQITRAVHEEILENADVSYETDPDIISGIELKSGGEKVAWSLEGYLMSLEEQALASLERDSRGRQTEENEEAGEKKGTKTGKNGETGEEKDSHDGKGKQRQDHEREGD